MKINISTPLEGLFHLRFKNQYEVASTFLRFQEYYESPRFRNKVFNLEEYMDWYVRVEGKFNYYEIYTGFNIPGDVLKPFYDGKFDPLSKKEDELLQRIALLGVGLERFYVIGTYTNRDNKHEKAHGLYYLDKSYKSKANTLIKPVKMDSFLTNNRYHKYIWKDETQAWLISGYGKTKYKRIQRELRGLFKERLK